MANSVVRNRVDLQASPSHIQAFYSSVMVDRDQELG
jgi:hypothetical protein